MTGPEFSKADFENAIHRIERHLNNSGCYYLSESDDDKVILAALRLAADPSRQAGVAEERRAVELLRRVEKVAKGIQADVASAHSGRGGGPSQWMREDDSEFRHDLRELFSEISAFLALPSSPRLPDQAGEQWLAFNDPFFTDGEPYGNTIRYIKREDAIAVRKRIHREVTGADFPGTDDEAADEFIAVNWAWPVSAPPHNQEGE